MIDGGGGGMIDGKQNHKCAEFPTKGHPRFRDKKIETKNVSVSNLQRKTIEFLVFQTICWHSKCIYSCVSIEIDVDD